MLAIPTAHSLSHIIWVDKREYPKSAIISLSEVTVCAAINKTAYSAATAESTTLEIIVDKN